jgi:hypothetical protein
MTQTTKLPVGPMTGNKQIMSSSPDNGTKNINRQEPRPTDKGVLAEERRLVPGGLVAGPTKAMPEQNINLRETVLPAGELFGPVGLIKNPKKSRSIPKVKETVLQQNYGSQVTYQS